ncbi:MULTISPECIES: hypothetical protein [Bacillus]|uniref:hypothetical protein n=1 Tax=Bacillus TaxID=1386 RepID=UPI0001CE35D8|nr:MULTISPECIES: hypothetical protein [Bacillus]API42569.1 hypothetical protein BSR08_08635 [Bacillus subtilis]ARI85002.1 hypothetical protein B7470_01990 [Bacillus subtilis]AVL03373.1 hypothetical protein BS21228_02560 [Bacillus subtilis]AYK76700.1 hypothetical protein D9C20_00115 [Bacillus subtilis subsp. subtilis]AYK84333.1 hypothetical protein D9C18_19915 [Bacillus subtilis subsp. subtilis]
MGALFLHLKPDEYLKKLYKTKKLVEKTSFSLQAERYPLQDISYGITSLFRIEQGPESLY